MKASFGSPAMVSHLVTAGFKLTIGGDPHCQFLAQAFA